MEVQSYRLAIQYLQAERYEESAIILESIVKDYPLCTEASWVLGLLYVLSGSPYQALKQWENLKTDNLLSYKQMVEEKLPLYDELYQKYNQALHFVQAGELHLAKNILHSLLPFQTELPLPVDFYHGYLLSLIVIGETESVPQELNQFPLYVKNSSVNRNLVKMLEDHPISEPVGKRKMSFKKSWSKRQFIGSSLVASLLIGGVGFRVFSQQKEINEAKPVIQQNGSVQNTETIEKEIAVSKDQQSGGQDKKQVLNNAKSLADRIKSSTISGLSSYRNGLAAFRKKDYKMAAAQMEKSQSLQPNEYFSDDALFFLIESKQRLNEQENILFLYDYFLSQTSKHYVFSPYRDELLLGKAKILMEAGRSNEALPLLGKILTDFKQEWTSVEAVLLMNQIKAQEKN
ncbi:tetratricopeptide repeat protein [Bacillaceae bacterium C204]|uniref:tetratricopeptide repeat protein n=1 Tax=Neobacillus sp. 204 TaxID=3383351 RepID=UPI00397C7B05